MKTHFTSNKRAIAPDARGVEALVPTKSVEQEFSIVVVACIMMSQWQVYMESHDVSHDSWGNHISHHMSGVLIWITIKYNYHLPRTPLIK